VAHASEPAFTVLHALRLKGFATSDVVGQAAGMRLEAAAAELDGLESRGLALFRDGRVTGWSLTPEGREVHAEELADDLEASGSETEVRAAYERFRVLNEPFKAVCTDWQLHGGDGPRQDLDRTHADITPIVDDLTGALMRFGPYRNRFEHAVTRVRAGEDEMFTRPLVGSYHDVWMELHEDLLLTLGIDRKEGET
jgi:hypothetical protein